MKKIKPAKPGSRRAMLLIRDDYTYRLEERISELQRSLAIAEKERDEALEFAGPERPKIIAAYEAAIGNFNSSSAEFTMLKYERDAARQEAAEWQRRYWELKGIQP